MNAHTTTTVDHLAQFIFEARCDFDAPMVPWKEASAEFVKLYQRLALDIIDQREEVGSVDELATVMRRSLDPAHLASAYQEHMIAQHARRLIQRGIIDML